MAPTDATEATRLLELTIHILEANPYGFLITSAPDGERHTRLVHHLRLDADGDIWIGTSQRSRKTVETRSNSRVAYAIEDRQRFAYAVLYCR